MLSIILTVHTCCVGAVGNTPEATAGLTRSNNSVLFLAGILPRTSQGLLSNALHCGTTCNVAERSSAECSFAS